MESLPISLQSLGPAARQLRVAVVTETYPPEVNGVAMTTGRLVDGLLRLDRRIQLIRPRQHAGDAPLNVEGFEEVALARAADSQIQASQACLPARSALIKLWSLRRPDVVQVVTEGPWLVGAGGCAQLRLPVVTEFHTTSMPIAAATASVG